MRKYLPKNVNGLIMLTMFSIVSLTFIQPVYAAGTVSTEPNLKVAFIGDSGDLDVGKNFDKVLQLIKNEGAQVVMHQGDFDYLYNPAGFEARINAVLGSNFPYFASIGNHDLLSWPENCGDPDGCYSKFFKDRMARIGVVPDSPDLNDEMYSAEYKGLKMVFAGLRASNASSGFLTSQLTNDNHIWKICSWHKTQAAMQVGGKGDEMNWDVYEQCRAMGAIIATAHEHSYQRTKTLSNITNQTVDSTCSDPKQLCVAPGKTFVFVSGLGGKSMRVQQRCLPATFPYGCKGEWASIYTLTQTANVSKYGALFITFNYQGIPNKAHGYFKNVDNQIIDEFDITTEGGSLTPSPTSVTPTIPTATPIITTGQCALKVEGDSNCDNKIDFVDLEILRKEMTGILTTLTADFNNDTLINVVDVEIFRRGLYKYLGINPSVSPTGSVILPAATNLTATCGSPGTQATLNWDPIPGANSYWLIIDDLSNPWSNLCTTSYPGDICTTTQTNSYSFGSTAGQRFQWGMQGFNGSWGIFKLGPEFTCSN